MALLDQQQHEEEQSNQIQPYGVCVGQRRIRNVQQVPYVPDMNIGRPLFRARQLPAHPVREQQHVMLQDRINQDVRHNMIQDNIAYNRRLYQDPHFLNAGNKTFSAPENAMLDPSKTVTSQEDSKAHILLKVSLAFLRGPEKQFSRFSMKPAKLKPTAFVMCVQKNDLFEKTLDF